MNCAPFSGSFLLLTFKQFASERLQADVILSVVFETSRRKILAPPRALAL